MDNMTKDYAVLRKSTYLQKPIAGNASKYNSYREAWSRIKVAQENSFFLEAMTIQERIINDRLISYLSRSTASAPLSKNARGYWLSFNNLIQHWRSDFPNPIQIGLYTNLIDSVNQWRIFRNRSHPCPCQV